MSRFRPTFLSALVVIAFALPAVAADSPAGTWRVSLTVPTDKGELQLSLLMMFSESDGKWAADFLDSLPPLPGEPTMDLTVKDDSIKFGLKFGPNRLEFRW